MATSTLTGPHDHDRQPVRRIHPPAPPHGEHPGYDPRASHEAGDENRTRALSLGSYGASTATWPLTCADASFRRCCAGPMAPLSTAVVRCYGRAWTRLGTPGHAVEAGGNCRVADRFDLHRCAWIWELSGCRCGCALERCRSAASAIKAGTESKVSPAPSCREQGPVPVLTRWRPKCSRRARGGGPRRPPGPGRRRVDTGNGGGEPCAPASRNIL